MDTVKELSLKLLIDTKSKRVVFAEAEKEAIDFLFNLLLLPVGSIIELVSKQNMHGWLHGSDAYLRANLDKNFLLKPKSVLSSGNIPLLPPILKVKEEERIEEVKYYRCSHPFHNYVTTSLDARCPFCSRQMTRSIVYFAGNVKVPKVQGEGGYVKEAATYMVSDDLVVMPMSTTSTVTILKKFHVTNFSSLEEKTVKFGTEEGLELLKASLQSTAGVLTKVFLPTKMEQETLAELDCTGKRRKV